MDWMDWMGQREEEWSSQMEIKTTFTLIVRKPTQAVVCVCVCDEMFEYLPQLS